MNFRFFLIVLGTVCVFLLGALGLSAYSYYESIHSDDPVIPTLSVDEGSAKIIRDDLTYTLTKDETYDLNDTDIVETERASRAIITWPDKSVTRLGPETRIVIRKMVVSRSYDQIEIAYDMERGKVWNTVIRTLIGDSYFDVHLPKESVVAGVRGTIFEINLESRYIHAVDHVTALRDKSGKKLTLLPGELVDSSNIWTKKGKEWLDITWNSWNTLSDTTYEKLRSLEIEKRISALTGSGKGSIDGLSRSIIGKIRGFEDIEIAKLIKNGDTEKLKKYSKDTLIKYYQKIPDLRQSEDRAKLRSIIISDTLDANIRESLDMHALWDSLDTGVISESTTDFLRKKGINMGDLQERFIEGARSDSKKILETLSGSLEKLFEF